MAEVIEMPKATYCAFCGRKREYVRWLVQSPIGICICEECAREVIRLIDEAYDKEVGE